MSIDIPKRWTTCAALVAVAAGIAFGTAGTVRQDATLTAADGAGGDNLGTAVGLAGDTVVVGAEDKNSRTGAAYVFKRTGQVWSQEAKLTASDASADAFFGTSVAISGDTIVVGAHGKLSDRGAAYVFTRTGAAWTQQAKLTATGGQPGDFFGTSVALSGDTAVVGAHLVGNAVGASYVFTRTGTVWTQQAKLTASDAADGDSFGVAVAVSGDTVVAGASGVGSLVGAAYVFKRTGTAWTQEARLAATSPANSDQFGRAVALAGAAAVIGASGTNGSRGAAYVFTRTGTTWTQEAALIAADRSANDNFGASVAVEGDSVVTGAHGKYRSSGVAYVFTRAGTAWTQTSRFSSADALETDFFGFAVAVEGATAVATAFGKDADKGAAYVFDLTGAPAPPAGYCLATKVKTKLNAKKPANSTLTVSGMFDTGPGAPDFSGAAAFEFGGFRVLVPAFVAKGRTLRHAGEGVTLTVTPSKAGSSRAAFSLKLTGDVDSGVARDGPMPFCFTNAAHTLTGTAKLTAGMLAPRAVAAPGLSVLKAAATIKGGGKDALKLTLGFATDGTVPAAAEDLTIAFGGTYTNSLTGGWVRKGNAWIHKANAPGITMATVDYVKGTITIVGSKLDLGTFAAGGNAVDVTITRGSDTRSVAVRMALAGTKLTY